MPRARSGSSADFEECGFIFVSSAGKEFACRDRGPHFCRPRALKVNAFFAEVLVHTKGRWARRPFVLRDWQRDDIIHPLFGQVDFDEQWDSYVRLYRIAWIEIGRGNGKSEIDAGIALYLEMADDEEAAEVYGAAKDVPQARKVWDVADRMTLLSPVLGEMRKSGEIKVIRQEKRLVYEPTASYYQVITADAAGELGHNPHGIVFDEVLTQQGPATWDALRTGMGKRVQTLMVGTTTAGDDPSGFAHKEHQFSERVLERPEIMPRRFCYIRSIPEDRDVFDEKNWKLANPALGDFLSVATVRDEAKEAKEDPTKEKAFRQFRANQWVEAATRAIQMHIWEQCTGEIAANPEWLRPKFKGKKCFAGLDLASKIDLAAWSLGFPGDEFSVLWRHWVPEAQLDFLDKHTGGQARIWARDGWLTVTEGDTIDYDLIYDAITQDIKEFKIVDVSYDPWSADPAVQQVRKRVRCDMYPVKQTYEGMSFATQEFLNLVKDNKLRHFGNPVAAWNAESLEIRKNRDDPDQIKPIKPDRLASGKRIDGMIAAILSTDGFKRRGGRKKAIAMVIGGKE